LNIQRPLPRDLRGLPIPASRPHTLLLAGLVCTLAACGGGGGDDDDGGGNNGWQQDVFQPSAQFEAKCVAPRSGNDPATNMPYPDTQGTVLDENNFLRSFSNETYLWYDEILDRNPANYGDPLAYFDVLRTTATTSSGQPRDKFHFTYDSAEWYQLSQAGVSAGYGAAWALLSNVPPREVRVAYTEPGSPATAPTANLMRGEWIVAVDGVDVSDNTQAGIDTLNEGLFSPDVGDTHTFTVMGLGGATRNISMVAAAVTADPVQNVHVLDTPSGRVGYLLFNDHILTAEGQLADAIETLASGQGIDDLVLDIRYNGGGYLYIASQLAFMIAGESQTGGRTFEEMQFNDKHPTTNPITGEPLEPTPFYNVTSGFDGGPANQPLPALNLSRVFVLTGPGSCSASEAIINGLRGIGVEVIQVGSTTCGKPYGFYAEDNCGITYFTIQFRGVNEEGFGDYTDGFSAQNQVNPGTAIPGCSVGDDFEHALGSEAEARLEAALAYRNGGTCPLPTGAAPPGFSKTGVPQSLTEGIVPKSPLLTNRIMTRWHQ
jgi:C-terminal processing protease CtpA/Prc